MVKNVKIVFTLKQFYFSFPDQTAVEGDDDDGPGWNKMLDSVYEVGGFLTMEVGNISQISCHHMS